MLNLFETETHYTNLNMGSDLFLQGAAVFNRLLFLHNFFFSTVYSKKIIKSVHLDNILLHKMKRKAATRWRSG